MIKILAGLFLILSLTVGISSFAEDAPPVLQGRLEHAAEVQDHAFIGEVKDAKTGQPLAGADVSVPDLGFSMKTDPQGQYRIPNTIGRSPVIMSIEKPGYQPFAISISEQSPPVFTIQLQHVEQLMVLDSALHHLGDGSYSPMSTSASNFRKRADGSTLTLHFSTSGLSISDHPYLQIGSIVGIDTLMMHMIHGNTIGANATPLLIKLNGTVIAQVQVDGDNQRFEIPRNLLNLKGDNLLEIEAGYHYPDPSRIDYDDMELIHVVFHA